VGSLNGELAYHPVEWLEEKHTVLLQDLYRNNFGYLMKENELLDINSLATTSVPL
jgi:hypothetical protein